MGRNTDKKKRRQQAKIRIAQALEDMAYADKVLPFDDDPLGYTDGMRQEIEENIKERIKAGE